MLKKYTNSERNKENNIYINISEILGEVSDQKSRLRIQGGFPEPDGHKDKREGGGGSKF